MFLDIFLENNVWKKKKKIDCNMGSSGSTKQIVVRSSSILKEYCQKYIPVKTTFSVLINRNTPRIKRIDQRVKSKTNLKN